MSHHTADDFTRLHNRHDLAAGGTDAPGVSTVSEERVILRYGFLAQLGERLVIARRRRSEPGGSHPSAIVYAHGPWEEEWARAVVQPEPPPSASYSIRTSAPYGSQHLARSEGRAA